uniref:Oxaloacetate tautomerase FAHD1, mitochondrial n=1 Tax=Ascaris suum TaxID=6253 RepID=F1LC36_ASCSU
MSIRLLSPIRIFYRQFASIMMHEGSFSNFRNIGTKIVCVGRNYRDHAIELSNAIPKEPLIFVKTTNSYVIEGEPIIIPDGCKNLHEEVELGVVIGKFAKRIKRENIFDYIAGYTVALDMTARDFQDEAKATGAPWFLAKSFDTSCPIGEFIERSRIADPHNVEIFCRINGVEKQRCKTNVMIFDIPTLIEYITQYISLEPGDLLLTGTPKGVSNVQHGDRIEFGIEGSTIATFMVY